MKMVLNRIHVIHLCWLSWFGSVHGKNPGITFNTPTTQEYIYDSSVLISWTCTGSALSTCPIINIDLVQGISVSYVATIENSYPNEEIQESFSWEPDKTNKDGSSNPFGVDIVGQDYRLSIFCLANMSQYVYSDTFDLVFPPTPVPTLAPSLSVMPTILSSSKIPSINPTFSPLLVPSSVPIPSPSLVPIPQPTLIQPTQSPQPLPTALPIPAPTKSVFVPSSVPVPSPSLVPIPHPTLIQPTQSPQPLPTALPIPAPTKSVSVPSSVPVPSPSLVPIPQPTLIQPTQSPQPLPTALPIPAPTKSVSVPSSVPVPSPSLVPIPQPTLIQPTLSPQPLPTALPIPAPTKSVFVPSSVPVPSPSLVPVSLPTLIPLPAPTVLQISVAPVVFPSIHSSSKPTSSPTSPSKSHGNSSPIWTSSYATTGYAVGGFLFIVVLLFLLLRWSRKNRERHNGGFMGEASVDHGAYLLADPTGNMLNAADVLAETQERHDDESDSGNVSLFSFLNPAPDPRTSDSC